MTDWASLKNSGLLGIVGGLGPLASAAFVKTIYDQRRGCVEQDQPRLVLWSDPSVPDRTTSLRDGLDEKIGVEIARAVDKLLLVGASRIVLCCVTAHAVLGTLSARARASLISLLDVIDTEVAASGSPHLVLCTSGARAAGLFDAGPRDLLVFPGEADQERVHDLIYQLKQSRMPAGLPATLAGLRHAYGVAGLVFGCTELHLVARSLSQSATASDGRAAGSIVDPLTSIARRMV